jgi:hypothetical protein
MKVLVDTSVWSLALRRKGPSAHPTVEKLTSRFISGQLPRRWCRGRERLELSWCLRSRGF